MAPTERRSCPRTTLSWRWDLPPRTSLAPELAGAGMEVYQVGDGSRVGSVMTAIGSAYTVGRML